MELQQRVDGIVEYMKSRMTIVPKVGLVLGSGLGDYADRVANSTCIPYSDIPHFPQSTVEGHKGQFVVGEHLGQNLIAMQGRFHYYEGYTPQEVTLPIRVMKKLGVELLILTNAAGGVNAGFKPGTLMMITDHINFSGVNPLIGQNLDAFGPRFPDMSDVYSHTTRQQLIAVAKQAGITLESGVYMMFNGPCFETPAEIRMAEALGADAVGMSTALEGIVAGHCGLRTIGISCITNLAAGLKDGTLNHQEVIDTASEAKERFVRVLDLALKNLV